MRVVFRAAWAKYKVAQRTLSVFKMNEDKAEKVNTLSTFLLQMCLGFIRVFGMDGIPGSMYIES